jgi:hypothetical protein
MGMTKAGLATGLGALSGSGVMRKGNQFNLQGAIMGGAMAYGASQLAAGLEGAGKAGEGGASAAVEAAREGTSSGIGSLSPEQLRTLTSGDTGILNQLSAGIEGGAGSGLQAAPEVISGAIPNISGSLATTAPVPGSIAAQNAYELQGLQEGYQSAFREPSMLDKIGTSISETPKNIGSFLDKATTGSTYEGLGTNLAETGKGTLSNIADAGKGLGNLVGLGADGTAAAARTAFMAPITTEGAVAGIMGFSGMAALEEQRKELQEQFASGSIPQEQYNEALARIDDQIATAKAAVAANPLNVESDLSKVSEGDSLYTKNTTGGNTLYDKDPQGGTMLYEPTPVGVASGGMIKRYAAGGIVPQDDQTGLPNQSPMNNINGQSLGKLFQGLGLGNLQQPQPASTSPQNTFNDDMPSGGSPFGVGIAGRGIGPSGGYDERMTGFPQVPYPNSGGGVYGGGGGQGAFPLQGQYGIVKMAKGGKVQHYGFGGLTTIGRIISSLVEQQEAANLAAAAPAAKTAAEQAPGIAAVTANPLRVSEDISKISNITGNPTNITVYKNNPENDFYDLYRNEKRTPYAAGGMAPRFLSGGGDGMSDSIKANIGGTQEARLADGEFVIPADVVSHLGNGSSKAGAKQLYSMMDKVRTARTGRKSQGKQINPRKYMLA